LLKPGGWLLVEIGAGQSTLLEREMDAVAPQLAAEFNKDYAGIARVMVLRQRGRDGGVRSRPGGSGGERGHF
jgi:methylase of polypeptide subunit release factors